MIGADRVSRVTAGVVHHDGRPRLGAEGRNRRVRRVMADESGSSRNVGSLSVLFGQALRDVCAEPNRP